MSFEATTYQYKTPIFVYGTLMIGQPNEWLWHNCVQRVETAYIEGGVLLDLGFYPILLEQKEGRVTGQLIRITPTSYYAIMHNLDLLEGYDAQHPDHSFYRRVRRTVIAQESGVEEAWVYVGNLPQMFDWPVIVCGDWAQYVDGSTL